MTQGTRHEFATNRDGQTVADALNGVLQYYLDARKEAFELCISTAYFNPEGFALIADALEQIGKVRLLLGAQPSGTPRWVRPLDRRRAPQHAEKDQVRRALEGHVQDIAQDRDLMGFSVEVDDRAKRLIRWLQESDVEVRRYEESFLHGKAFIVATGSEGVIAGSSNFTAGGLAHNLELNLGQYQPSVVERVLDWFEDLWREAIPFDLAAVYEERFKHHNPHTIYLRMLWELYGAEIQAEAEAADTKIRLTSFQKDGVWRSERILDRYSGVLIADGVGLGKTFIAGELIQRAIMERRQRVLVIAPATLRDGPWEKFKKKFQLGVEVVSFEELAEALGPKGSGKGLVEPPDRYAMVVIDESHALRNPDTQRAHALRHLLQGSPPKDLVLLTATPVNNSLWDLYYLLTYFLRNDDAFADVGIRSLRKHFNEAMQIDPEDLSPDKLFDILDAVGVRRTRHFVKRYYPNDKIEINGQETTIHFPKPRVSDVKYDLEPAMPGFFDSFAHALTCYEECVHDPPVADEPILKLARYQPSKYRRGAKDGEAREVQLSGLLRSGLLKRFESSAQAFGLTCERMAGRHQAFLDLLDEGKVANAEALDGWMKSDAADLDEFLEQYDEDLEDARGFKVDELRKDAQEDRAILLDFAKRARALKREDDPKLTKLDEELAEIAKAARDEGIGDDDLREKRKVIIFTYYADTVDWIAEHLINGQHPAGLNDFKGRIVHTTGDDDNTASATYGFAPKATEAPAGWREDKYDILITTDVLAEGVNLQQARHIVNYDLPWNPMRLVQRHGRIDRIGSPHPEVFLRCFLPDDRLDDLLRLEERLRTKIAQAAKSIGVESEVLPGSMQGEVVLSETRDEIDRLKSGDAELFETAGERSAYSGEEYRQELRVAFEEPGTPDLIRALPWGAGSGKITTDDAPPGFVFCARVGDHSRPLFRFVDLSKPASEQVISDTLTSLAHAQCAADTERVLPNEVHLAAYDAWAVARANILEEWSKATDPANLQPDVPKTMREAGRILAENPPAGMEITHVDRLVEAIEAPYGERIQKLFRQAMKEHTDPHDQSRAIVDVAEELGLQPPAAVEPLPLIEESDIHLVCWLAIAPSD